MKKETLYALIGLLLTSAGALLTLWLVFVSRNPELFADKKPDRGQKEGVSFEEEWTIGEYNEDLFPTGALFPSVMPVPTEMSKEAEKDILPEDSAQTGYAKAGVVLEGKVTEEIKNQNFYIADISEQLKIRILQGISDTAQYEELLAQQSYVHVLHYDFEGRITTGELLVYTGIAQSVLEIFQELYDAEYPIEKIRLVSEYAWDDAASMQDNNTSAFNFRKVAGTNDWSKHALGMAIDINPLYNPYVYMQGNYMSIQPGEAAAYADRNAACAYYIQAGDVCYEAFVSRGFTWGGDWENPKDYQHFQVGKE